MDRFRISILLCVAGLACGAASGSESAEAIDSTVADSQALAEEVNWREQLAQDVSAAHLLARIKADELLAQNKFPYARQLVRKAQEMLLSQREHLSVSIFGFLYTLGEEKLQTINDREIAFLRKRVEAERIAARKMKEASEQPDIRPTAQPTEPSPRTKVVPTPISKDIVIHSARRGLGTLLTRIDYEDMSLVEVLEDLRNKSGVNIVANWQSLANAGIEKTTSVDLKLSKVSAGRVLKIILDNLSTRWAKVSYVVQDEVVVIASAEDLAKIIDTRVYDVTHLMMETKDKRGGGWFAPGGFDRRSGQNRGGSRSDGNRRSYSRNSGRSGSTYTEEAQSDRIEKITALVRAAVPAESWREDGGPGSLAIFGTRLIVTQTAENHAKISKTLSLLGW